MSRLHLFDMDGTLLRGSSANVELARELGLVEEFREMDARFAVGEIDSGAYAGQAYGLWRELTAERVAAAFDGAPWLAGIREVWSDIRARGEYCAVISMSPDFFVRRLLEWGAHAAHGTRFPEPPFGDVPLDLTGILRPESKVLIADRLCADYGVTRAECVAYGDSLSDTALFGVVPVSVAVNGDHNVAALATLAYRGDDLREAYALTLPR
ncbi:HAD family phosphatase [Streptomyces sp. SL13]|uniref:phosphoserine phosphatase n=1 Tax=Streptantibioticus silvisoli TaxID=2705255 RepID=A0AA90JXU1_9ACTN|nr:HAD family phosphatase [Streptantibioticus silvisoli]MDI5961933.1 HAD family phosphatase [Streptantibioticus silvisoli]MDI5970526.1 HAD family phosphatase [Streptantibioticus silvisoli]